MLGVFVAKKPFTISNTYCSLTVLALISIYGGHCFSVHLPSKLTLRLPVSHNNVLQHTNKFKNSLTAKSVWL